MQLDTAIDFAFPKPFKIGAWQVYGNYDYPDAYMYVGSFSPKSSTHGRGRITNVGNHLGSTPIFRIFAIGR